MRSTSGGRRDVAYLTSNLDTLCPLRLLRLLGH